MELQFLHMLQNLQQDWLDSVMIFFTGIGEAGICWILLGLALTAIKRTRRCGLTVLVSMALTYLLGNILLKNIIGRPRPFIVDTSVTLLIEKPSEYSFPSGHTASSFAAAAAVFAYYRVPGLLAFLVAALIAFSRMYLFVHYPTDILGGILLGTADAWLVTLVFYRGKKNR